MVLVFYPGLDRTHLEAKGLQLLCFKDAFVCRHSVDAVPPTDVPTSRSHPGEICKDSAACDL